MPDGTPTELGIQQAPSEKPVSSQPKETARFTPPWETRTYPEDKYGFVRTQFITQNRWESGIWGGLGNVIFKHPLDKFNDQDLGELTSSAKIGEQRPTILDMDTESIINHLLQNEKVHESEEIRLLKRENHPTANPLYADVLRGLAACSIYDQNGNIKSVNDGEGYMLLTAWLSAKSWNPALSQSCFDELMRRRDYFGFEDASGQEQIRIKKVVEEKPQWGKILFDKISLSHSTDYLPAIGEYPAIMPRVDTDAAARWTIHTFANGMVEEHGGIPGFELNSWEGKKYCIVFSFKDSLAQTANGVPTCLMPADTFWSLRPGKGFQLPAGSFILAPESETSDIAKKFSEYGIKVVGYDSNTSLRVAAKHLFEESDIPFNENATYEEAREADEELAKLLGSHAALQDDSFQGAIEGTLRIAQSAISNASEINQHDGNINSEEARRISTTRSQENSIKNTAPRRITALALALSNSRERILDSLTEHYNSGFYKDVYANGAIETAVVAGLL